ncbi:MAG: hypothetical protein FJX40_14250 [Alphaproteobacteria bacterium]|nr:hypothetical protein [Alphaproteobacteria bacterium]MBM3642179.1 hypothetical protein [Alphaproteobacteria bacterium]
MFAIFGKLGGDDAALEIIRARGDVRKGWPSKDTLKVWKRNGELPGTVIKILMAACDEREVSYCAADFELNELESTESTAGPALSPFTEATT